MSERQIRVFDTTLRDGEQSPGCTMTLEEKVRMARQLEHLGVDVIEAGFPAASEGDAAAVAAVAAACRGVSVAALCRASEDDIRRAAEALDGARSPRIHIFLATSDIHLQYKLHRTRDQVLEMADRAVRWARSWVDEVEFSAEDATRTDPDYLCEVMEVVADAGGSILNVPDTVGYAIPSEYASLVRLVRERVVRGRDITVSVHCHNDLGLAVANTLAAIDAGAEQVECTINGIGERAGNAALEEIVMACHVRGDRLPFRTNIRSEQLYPTSQLLSSVINCPVQPNKAVVGRNAFAHEAGIHQHGVLSNALCYEIMTPESVGAPASRIVLGKHSGRHALAARYAELGYDLSQPDLESAYARMLVLADRKKRIYDQDLLSLIEVSDTAGLGAGVSR